jgi:hypothetical protein
VNPPPLVDDPKRWLLHLACERTGARYAGHRFPISSRQPK